MSGDSGQLNFRDRTIMALYQSRLPTQLKAGVRKLTSRLYAYRNSDFLKEAHSSLQETPDDSSDYIQLFLSYVKKLSAQSSLHIKMDIDKKTLDDIVSSNKPHIFVMNHDSLRADPYMFLNFVQALYHKYQDAGSDAICPRAKLVLSKALLNSMSDSQREVLEKLGAVGINADICNSATRVELNRKAFRRLLNDFIADKSHIFIFPEGRNRIFPWLDIRSKIQPGVADMIRLLVKKKEEVRVVPLAFAYSSFTKPWDRSASLKMGDVISFKAQDGMKAEQILDVVSEAMEESKTNAQKML